VKRRRALYVLGAAAIGSLAGCLGGGAGDEPTPEPTTAPPTTQPSRAGIDHPGTLEATIATNGDYPADDSPADGYPPPFDEPPAAPDVDPSTFETLEVNGETVRLAPIDAVIDWYYRGEARFVDARGLGQYRNAHVYGAVNSPATFESRGGMVPGWPTDDRIVTYCGCPHHLSAIRAAGLRKVGVEAVYALDEGFLGQATAWKDRGYPMAGEIFVGDAETEGRTVRITGRVAARHAGSYVWASAGRHYEAAPVEANGRYDLHLRVYGLDPGATVAVRTPAGTETHSLRTLV
jgi:rhodanese-related sulfurtransferase